MVITNHRMDFPGHVLHRASNAKLNVSWCVARRCTMCQCSRTSREKDTSPTLVHVLQMPLVGWETLDLLLPEALSTPLTLHAAVILEEGKPIDGDSEESVESLQTSSKGELAWNRHLSSQTTNVWLFDFLPEEPRSPTTAMMLLSGKAVPGKARSIRLKGVPRRRLTHIGESPLSFAVAFEKAQAVQTAWNERKLRLLVQDCNSHVEALLRALEVVQ